MIFVTHIGRSITWRKTKFYFKLSHHCRHHCNVPRWFAARLVRICNFPHEIFYLSASEHKTFNSIPNSIALQVKLSFWEPNSSHYISLILSHDAKELCSTYAFLRKWTRINNKREDGFHFSVVVLYQFSMSSAKSTKWLWNSNTHVTE